HVPTVPPGTGWAAKGTAMRAVWPEVVCSTIVVKGAALIAVASPELVMTRVSVTSWPMVTCAGDAVSVALVNCAGVCTRICDGVLCGDCTAVPLFASEPATPNESENDPAAVAVIFQVKLAEALAPMSLATGGGLTVATCAVPDCETMVGSTPSAAASPLLVARMVTLKVCPTLTSAGIVGLAETESCAGACTTICGHP